ncbi:MAG: hypothetical protein GYA21_14735 [Myxococcales bacterium]|nr:hypothetical protein [Myxococcales bacterium]
MQQNVLPLLCLFLCCCTQGTTECKNDADCSEGFRCVAGVCYLRFDGGEPAGDDPDAGIDAGDPGPSQDDGSDPGPAEEGGDTGGDPGEPWIIQPGVGVGPLKVSQGLTTAHQLSEIQVALGESGNSTGVEYARSFRNDTLWVSGIETSGNKVFDSNDRVLTIMVRKGFNARTAEWIAPGSSLAFVHGQPAYATPDRSVVAEPYGSYPGGLMESYFRMGAFLGYDENQNLSAFTVTRPFQTLPTGTINPAAATVTIGSTTIVCGDGTNSGTRRSVHRNLLGEPDAESTFTQMVQGTSVQFYLDSYRVLGFEFVGGDDVIGMTVVDKLVVLALYPLFYGQTAAGHGLGSKKSEWELELGAPVAQKNDPTWGTIFVYTAGSRYFAIMYTNQGASPDDAAILLVLNYYLE